jgi:ABC-type glycerol-3-phosphate transport system substrate-binding protein
MTERKSDQNSGQTPPRPVTSMSRRQFLQASAFGAAAAALAACAPAATTAAPAATSATAATAVPAAIATGTPNVNTGAKQIVQYQSWWFQEGNRGITWNAFIKEFNDSQKDIEVQAQQIPFTDYETKIIVQVNAGKLAGDIVQSTPELAPRLVRSNLLAPLDSVLTTNNITDLSSAHDSFRANGHLYGLDMVTVAFGLIYNSKMYADAKVSPATNPDELVSVAKALTNRDKQVYGFWSEHLVSDVVDFWFKLEEYCMPYGGVWATGKTPLLTSDPIIKGLKLFKALYDGAFPQGADGPTADRLFGTNALAQQLTVSAAVGSYAPKFPDLYPLLKSAPIPWAGNKSIARIHPMMVNGASPVKDAALQFVTYMYKPDNYRRMVEGCQDVIFSIKSAEDPAYLATLPWRSPGFAGVTYITPFDAVGDFLYNFSEFGNIVITNFADVLNTGKTVEDAMAAAQTQAEALAQRIT